MAQKKLHFETLQLHVGQEQPDPTTDARAVPIYQTTSYVFHNSAHAAARFELKDAGNIYGRLTNPTQNVLEERLAALEGGVAALAVASGAAAVTYAFQNITCAGDHIVAAKTIYGGTYNLLDHTLPAYGVTATFVDPADLSNFEKAIRPNTKAVFIETLGNPNSNIIDIDATIVCERDSHKGIIIGKGGSMLKKIGSNARYEMERLLDTQVNLKLWVKVRKDWRDSELMMKNFGYNKDDI